MYLLYTSYDTPSRGKTALQLEDSITIMSAEDFVDFERQLYAGLANGLYDSCTFSYFTNERPRARAYKLRPVLMYKNSEAESLKTISFDNKADLNTWASKNIGTKYLVRPSHLSIVKKEMA